MDHYSFPSFIYLYIFCKNVISCLKRHILLLACIAGFRFDSWQDTNANQNMKCQVQTTSIKHFFLIIKHEEQIGNNVNVRCVQIFIH